MTSDLSFSPHASDKMKLLFRLKGFRSLEEPPQVEGLPQIDLKQNGLRPNSIGPNSVAANSHYKTLRDITTQSITKHSHYFLTFQHVSFKKGDAVKNDFTAKGMTSVVKVTHPKSIIGGQIVIQLHLGSSDLAQTSQALTKFVLFF